MTTASSTSSTTFLLREVFGGGFGIGASSHTAIMLTHGDFSERITALPQQSCNPCSPKISLGCEKPSTYIKSFYQLITNTTTIFLFKCSDISYKAIKTSVWSYFSLALLPTEIAIYKAEILKTWHYTALNMFKLRLKLWKLLCSIKPNLNIQELQAGFCNLWDRNTKKQFYKLLPKGFVCLLTSLPFGQILLFYASIFCK